MSGGCTIRFDENDDVVLDDIPTDIFENLEKLAVAEGISLEDQARILLMGILRSSSTTPIDRDTSPSN